MNSERWIIENWSDLDYHDALSLVAQVLEKGTDDAGWYICTRYKLLNGGSYVVWTHKNKASHRFVVNNAG